MLGQHASRKLLTLGLRDFEVRHWGAAYITAMGRVLLVLEVKLLLNR